MRNALVSLFVLLLLAPPALASPKVSVDVDGDDTGLVRRKVKAALGEHEIDRPLVVYGTLEKEKKKVNIRLTITTKDGTVVGEVRVDAATREAAAARAAKKIWSAIKLPPAKAQPAGKSAAKAPQPKPAMKGKKLKEVAASPSKSKQVAAKPPKAKAKPAAKDSDADSESESDSDSDSESESDSGSDSGSESADGVEMTAPSSPQADGQSWLSVSAGPELVGRHFTYRDDVFSMLRQYDLSGAAALGVTADAYPLHTRTDWLGGLGGAARIWYARPFDSDATNGETYRSKGNGWSIGARWRRTIAGIDVAGALDYGSESFTVDAAGSEYESMVPAVGYKYVRPGVSGRMAFMGDFAAELSLGYRQVLSLGEVTSEAYFPRASARGFDIEGQVSYALPWYSLDVRAGAGLEQYGFNLNPEPGDTRVAGGATDRYPRLFLRVGYTR